MNILLFGKGGQVGWELQRSLSVLGHVTALDFDSQDHCGDFSNPDGIAQAVRALNPDVIVNAAAHTAVDKAESEPELAQLLNATTPGVLAEEAARLNAWLVHYSTDYVFDGSGSRPWVETDRPAPLSVYGRTKWEGEQRIQQSGAKHLILRTSWVYAARGGNFAKTMLRLAQERERLTVIDDQWGGRILRAGEHVGAVLQLALDDGGEQLVLRPEVAVEGAAGQPDRLHQGIHAGGLEAALLREGAAALDQLLAGLFLVGRSVAHGRFLDRGISC